MLGRRVCTTCENNPACQACTGDQDCAWDESCVAFSKAPLLLYCQRRTERECWFNSQCQYNEKCNIYTRRCVSISSCQSDVECPRGICDTMSHICVDQPSICPAFYAMVTKPTTQCLLICKDDSQCRKYVGIHYTCKDERCIPPDCTNAKDGCPPGTECTRAGICLHISRGHNCTKNEECGFGGSCRVLLDDDPESEQTTTCQPVCYNDGMCPKNKRCLYGACWDPCFACKSNYMCRYDMCILKPEICTKYKGTEVTDGICHPSIFCQEEANCPPFTKCDVEKQQCLPDKDANTTIVTGMTCFSKEDCLAMPKCQYGNCECLFGKCIQSCRLEACRGRTICDTYKGLKICIPDEVGPPERCSFDGMLIRGGQCRFPECTSHLDCNDRICLHGECREIPRSCYESADCEQGFVCKYGRCFQEHKICTRDSDCHLYYDALCDFGLCIPKIYKTCPDGMAQSETHLCKSMSCSVDKDCPNALGCVRENGKQGICLDTYTVPPIYQTCSQGQYMVNGRCVRIQCSGDGHCKYGQYCSLGVCQPREPECSEKVRQDNSNFTFL